MQGSPSDRQPPDPDFVHAGSQLDRCRWEGFFPNEEGRPPSFSTDPNASRRLRERVGGIDVGHQGGTYFAAATIADTLSGSIADSEELAVARTALKVLHYQGR